MKTLYFSRSAMLSVTLPVLFLLLLVPAMAQEAHKSGLNDLITAYNEQTGDIKPLFNKSYALIIANTLYQNPKSWDTLSYPYKDAIKLKKVLLEIQKFDGVFIEKNLKYTDMKAVIEKFIEDYGMEPDNRILIFYTGHGARVAVHDGSKEDGFVVPVDCPSSKSNKTEFLKKAIGYGQWIAWAENMQCRHALLAFDCCYGGKVFDDMDKDAGDRTEPLPVNIEAAAMNYARFFMTAGHQMQTVPDKSYFCDYFLRAISGEDPTADGDPANVGWLTGYELGQYVQTKVLRTTNQKYKPLYGLITGSEVLDKGNFIFVLPDRVPVRPPEPATTATLIITTPEAGYLTVGSAIAVSLKAGSENTYKLPAGSYTLKFEYATTAKTYNEILVLTGGQGKRVKLNGSQTNPSGKATLNVKVEDSGVLYINGEYICKINPGPGKDVEVPAGKVNLEFKCSSTPKKHTDVFNISNGEKRPYTIGRSYNHSEIKKNNAKAHLISVPLPGLGRKYVGRNNQWYPTVIFWGGIGGSAASFALKANAYQKYEVESDPVQSQKLLDNSRMYQNIAYACIGISAAVFIVEQIIILTSKRNSNKNYGKVNLNVPQYAMFNEFNGQNKRDQGTGFTKYDFDGPSGLGNYYDIYPMVNQTTLYPESTNLFGIKLNTGLQDSLQIQYLFTKSN